MNSCEALLDGLDEQQRLAASTLNGPVRIIACAGAGKTRTITRRIAYACATKQWESSRVLAVTFSVKAAGEMRSRLEQLEVAQDVKVSTFHSAALQQIRQVWDDVCAAPFPEIVQDATTLMKLALSRVPGLDELATFYLRDIIAEINWAKVSLIAPEDYARVCAATHRNPPVGLQVEQFMQVYEAYELEKNLHNLIDFNDLLLLASHILADFPQAANKIRSAIGWITVDEYQDISPLQHYLLRLWMGENRDICVVGDPAQTIYSFAGATSYYLLSFMEEFSPVTADIHLNTDYRSTQAIVGVANTVLAHSDRRSDYLKMKALTRGGMRVSKRMYQTDGDEALAVAEQIARLVHEEHVLPSDCAILTRTNAQQQVLCRALHSVGLQYTIRKDVDMRLTALERSQTQSHAPTNHDMAIKTVQANEQLRKQLPVTIATIHASKGLEFKHVYVVGCAEGLLPFGTATSDEDLEEERRLMYVAVTRAETTLHLSYAMYKNDALSQSNAISANGRARSVSRFLS